MEEHLTPTHHTLISSLISFYIIIFLVFPNHFTRIALSPVLISTAILLISFLRLASTQKTKTNINSNQTEQTHQNSANKDQNLVPIETDSDKKSKIEPNPLFSSFIEWNVRAPLEVIYEEEDEFGYPLLYSYYSEDSDKSSSEENFSLRGNCCFEWEEEEEEREGMIEIELNGKITKELFNFEEDNLIEIDIFSGDG